MQKKKSRSWAHRAILAMTVWSCIACAPFAADGMVRTFNSTFAPAVTADSTLVLGINNSREQWFKILDNLVERLLKIPEVDKRAIGELRQKIDAYKRDPYADAPQEVRDFLKECDLLDVYPRWAVLSVEGPLPGIGDNMNFEGLALAISVDVDLKKLISVVSKKLAEEGEKDISFREISVGGETAWRIVPNDKAIAMNLKATKTSLHLASLDGKLLLVATSRNTLEKQILLYRKGKGKGTALGDFSARNGELMHIQVSGIGNMIKEAALLDEMHDLLPGDLAEISSISEDILTGLQTLTADIKVTQSGTLSETIRLKAASEDDAELIRALAGTTLIVAKTFISRSSNVPKEFVDALKAFHVNGQGDTIEFSCDDAMAILGGAMFPAISSAMQKANTSAIAMKGRNLFVAIIAANTEREALGLGNIWPKTQPEEGADTAKDPLSGAMRSASEYFTLLFDVANIKASDQWKPYVSGVDLSVLNGAGVPAIPNGAKKIDAKNCLWCVAANITDEVPDCIPVLISANFNPELLLSKWDGSSNSKERLPIGPAHGASKSLFGDKMVVIVRKGGSAECIKEKDLTYKTLYRGESFDLTQTETPLVYLTPEGIAKPAKSR